MKSKLEKLNKKLMNTFCKGDYKANKRLQRKIEKLKKNWWENIEYDISEEEIAFRERIKGNIYYHE